MDQLKDSKDVRCEDSGNVELKPEEEEKVESFPKPDSANVNLVEPAVAKPQEAPNPNVFTCPYSTFKWHYGMPRHLQTQVQHPYKYTPSRRLRRQMIQEILLRRQKDDTFPTFPIVKNSP